MKSRKIYASKLTKEDLIKSGITLVTEDGYVFKGDKQITPNINPNGYLIVPIYELDENGDKIKVPIMRQLKGCKKLTNTYIYKLRPIGLHRLMWAWFNNEVPEGYIVDHVNNKHEAQEDYHLSNLQLLTQKDNLLKERPNYEKKELYCNMTKSRSFYENKLLKYEKEYEEAKKEHNAELVHKLRSNISNTKARLRYWDSHKEEYENLLKEQQLAKEKHANWKQNIKDRKLLSYLASEYKKQGDKFNWHQYARLARNWDAYDDTVKEQIMKSILKYGG